MTKPKPKPKREWEKKHDFWGEGYWEPYLKARVALTKLRAKYLETKLNQTEKK